ncbi:MAG TPA: serine hydrolase [Acidobacteriota bacterium]|nr:serine hydrolase [Acidobacteriota bacterium]
MRKSLIATLSVILVLFSVTCVAAQEKPQAEPFEGFSAFVEQMMKEWEVPGVALAVVKDGKIVFTHCYGYRDLEQKLPVTPQTIFSIGSTTKAFTAFAMGILVDEGKVQWDKPVRTWLPDFQLMDEYASAHITPVDMLNHISGLPRHDGIWYNKGLSRKELYNRLRYLEPSAEFRQKFQYNNLMYTMAGYLVGQVSGGTWEDFVTERIFKPLGMSHSIFGPPEDESVDLASPYSMRGGKLTKVPQYRDWAIGPCGSIYSTIEDMGKWLLVHLNNGKVGETALVTESTFNLLHSPKTVGGSSTAEMPISAYGFGWSIQPYRGHHLLWHNGSIDGFFAFICFLPYDNYGMVILTNEDNHWLAEIVAYTTLDRVFNLEGIDWNARVSEPPEEEAEEAEEASKEAEKAFVGRQGTTPSHPLTEYVGTYEHPAYGRVIIGLAGDKLEFVDKGKKNPLEHYHYDVFLVSSDSGEEERWQFNMDINGDIASVQALLQEGVDPIVFNRVAEESLKNEEYLRRFVGEFKSRTQTIKIEMRNGVLFTVISDQPDCELVPVRENKFKLKTDEGYSLEFKLDEAGNVSEAVFHKPYGDFPVKRKN